MKSRKNEGYFTSFADWVSQAMGTPANIIAWLVIVGTWFALFALHVFSPDTNVLPAWFTSNAFNFPLNTVTTLAELYIGFLIAAAANRVEKRNWELHQKMAEMLESIDRIELQTKQGVDELILNIARIEDTKIDPILKLLVEPEMKARKRAAHAKRKR